MKLYKQMGIGLLELMLSLAIIAILLIMATRYYQSAHQNQLTNQGVDMFGAVQGAVQTYRLDNPAASLDSLTIAILVSTGYLPNNYGSGTTSNPWGGPISLKADTSAGTLAEGMAGVPPGSCENLAGRVNGTIAGASGGSFGASCPGTGTNCPTDGTPAITAGAATVCALYPL